MHDKIRNFVTHSEKKNFIKRPTFHELQIHINHSNFMSNLLIYLEKENEIKKVRSCVLEERRELDFHKAK